MDMAVDGQNASVAEAEEDSGRGAENMRKLLTPTQISFPISSPLRTHRLAPPSPLAVPMPPLSVSAVRQSLASTAGIACDPKSG